MLTNITIGYYCSKSSRLKREKTLLYGLKPIPPWVNFRIVFRVALFESVQLQLYKKNNSNVMHFGKKLFEMYSIR